MKNSKRVAWYEEAYKRIREKIVPEAPPEVTLSIGFPSKKRSGKNMVVGECAFDCIKDHGLGFGGENLITLHLLQGHDIVATMATLVHEMIHAALEPDVKHGKEFRVMADKVGLCKPWTATEPDETLRNALRGIMLEMEEELGYLPVGSYTPPPPLPKKPPTTKKVQCQCAKPRVFSLSKKKLADGGILCAVCKERFRPIEEEAN